MAKTSCHVENFRGGFCHILPPYFVSPYFGSTPGHFGRKYGANMERFSLEIMGLTYLYIITSPPNVNSNLNIPTVNVYISFAPTIILRLSKCT